MTTLHVKFIRASFCTAFRVMRSTVQTVLVGVDIFFWISLGSNTNVCESRVHFSKNSCREHEGAIYKKVQHETLQNHT